MVTVDLDARRRSPRAAVALLLAAMALMAPSAVSAHAVLPVVIALPPGWQPEGLQARYVADVGDGIRVVAVWESKEHADRFLEERLAPALATAFDEPQGRPEVLQGEVANSYTA